MSPTSLKQRTRVPSGGPARTRGRTTYAPPHPRRDVPAGPPLRRAPRPQAGGGRLGSRQVVSVRGRRVAKDRTDPRMWRIVTLAFCLLVAGVGLAMYLSGLSTQQTFHLQQLTAQEAQLDNRIETLDRDLEHACSAAGLAQRAEEEHLGVPVQPGVLAVDDRGEVTERRPAEAETRPVVDVNGRTSPRQGASSNPEKTSGVSGNLRAVPQAQTRGAAEADPAQPAPAAPPAAPPAQPRSNPVPYPAGTDR